MTTTSSQKAPDYNGEFWTEWRQGLVTQMQSQFAGFKEAVIGLAQAQEKFSTALTEFGQRMTALIGRIDTDSAKYDGRLTNIEARLSKVEGGPLRAREWTIFAIAIVTFITGTLCNGVGILLSIWSLLKR